MQIEKLCKLREIYYAPRMMKTNLLAEFLLYTNYEPYALSSGTFPVPPVGKEFDDDFVLPMDMYNEEDENTEDDRMEGKCP